jgi:hypothetical protein
MKLKINQEEHRILKKATSVEQSMLNVIKDDDDLYLIFDDNTGIRIIELISDYLQNYGFNIDYTPNYEGRIIENILDRLYEIGF